MSFEKIKCAWFEIGENCAVRAGCCLRKGIEARGDCNVRSVIEHGFNMSLLRADGWLSGKEMSLLQASPDACRLRTLSAEQADIASFAAAASNFDVPPFKTTAVSPIKTPGMAVATTSVDTWTDFVTVVGMPNDVDVSVTILIYSECISILIHYA